MEYSRKKQELWDRFKNILEYCPEKLCTNFCENKKILNTAFYQNCERILDNIEGSFAVSISGGVDSMLLSYFCSIYAVKNLKTLILIHINYNNRDSCLQEVEFLEKWADLLKVKLHVQHMDIVRDRSSKARDEYETVTKEIRFNFYRSFGCPVLLGHNKDDCYENVFANLSKQIHFENLFGMNETLSENKVLIVRPFLSIVKKSIIEKAHELCIPYLEDSTPAWSRRGKMRDSLIPVIESFDQNILKGMDQFVEHTRFLQEQWEINFKTWREIINYNKDESYVELDTENLFYKTNKGQLSFWIRFWFSLERETRPSNKSFKQLIQNIESFTSDIKSKKQVLDKTTIIEMSETKLVISFNKV
jgi:tRNA(Ile)-lysidine synthetase-like protein